MSSKNNERRNSRALIPSLITDPVKKAEAESANGLLQYDEGIAAVLSAIERIEQGNIWRLRPSLILGLQRRALLGISSYAGNYRPSTVEIEQSIHTPPDAHLVAELVEDMCEYVNDHWTDCTPIHLAAYLLWRLNWVHPFDDGNGRTSRIVSYVVMLIRLGTNYGGSPTIPDLIKKHRKEYFSALDAADDAYKRGVIDVSEAENLISSLFAMQLTSIYKLAGGTIPQETPL